MHAPRRDGQRALALDRIDLVKEARWLFLVAGHRRHHGACPGASQRDIEQPPLLGQLGRDERDTRAVAAGQQVDQQLRAEQRTAPAQIGPDAFLHVRDADEIPFQALAGVCGQHGHRLRVGAASAERIARNLLRREVRSETGNALVRQPVGEARGRGEQLDDGVEVTIGGGTGLPAGVTGLFPPPGQPAR